LFNKPSIILADEPTGNLDKGNGEILLEYFKKVNLEMHQTFLIATHNPELSSGMNRVINLVDGKIV
ncbi:MAG: ABC transporter ATP-binding protein, partial [Chitinispirillaceae bacterium]|nr:ABC transporter ATP-binding protein [Chitinispirillaceae bacterium]